MADHPDYDPEIGMRRISMEEIGRRISVRRAELAAMSVEIELPRNAGKNRTESKRVLLKAIEDAGGKW